jgi:hypothetical protein
MSTQRTKPGTWQQLFDAMHDALKAWMLVESEMKENHPSPDLALRAGYRKEAVKLTRAVLAAIDAERNKP